MKKKLLKALSVLLAVVLTLTAAPLSGFVGLELPDWLDVSINANAATYTGTCGTNLTWSYDDSTYVLTISGTGVMNDYSYSNRPWESYEDKIKEIVIEDGVTTIGKYAFYDFGVLISITIPDSVTIIGDRAFYYCDSLASLTIPDGVTTIGDSAFRSSESLTNVTIGKNVSTIGEDAFIFCDNLVNITVDTNNQYYSSDEFGVLFNKEKTTLIRYPAGNIKTTYIIPDSVISIYEYAFSDCVSLTSVAIPDNATTIGDRAFLRCEGLTSITISDSVTTIGDSAFYSCDSLTTVTLGNSVTDIGDYAFDYCTSLTSIIVNGNNQYFSCDEYGVLFNKEKTTLIRYPLGNTRTNYVIPDSVKAIGESVFYDCENLTSVTIPDSVITIGDDAFYSCDRLTSVIIPDSVISIGSGAFSSCDNLETIYVGKNVACMDGCLIDLLYDDYFDYDDYYDYCAGMPHAFGYCDNLKNITVDEKNQYYSSDEYGVLFNKDKTALFKYPEGNTRTSYTVPNSVTTIYDSAFQNCDNLESIFIRFGVTTIDYGAFMGCYNLTSVVIPNSVTTINYYAFDSCYYLTNVYYTGSEDEWNEILIESGNDSLLNATIEFNYVYSCDTHDYIEDVTMPTCTTDGYTTYTCSLCGDTYVDDYIVASGHLYESTVTSPTCTKKGYTTYTCSVCADNYISDYTEALGHTEVDAVEENYISPTCTVSGKCDLVVYCSVCSTEISRTKKYITALGHSYDDGVETPPTETNKGYLTYTCTVCGDTEVECIYGHSWAGGATVEPTCEYGGFIHYYCDVCYESYEEFYAEPLGHDCETSIEYESGEYCGEPGSYWEIAICKTCGYEVNREIFYTDELPHLYETEISTSPTCTETGVITNTCTICSTQVEDTIPATGHTLINVKAKESTCVESGYDAYEYCTVCDYTTIVEITAKGHSYNSVVTASTCTEQGYTTYTCSVCNHSYCDNYTEALGHTEANIVVENYTDETCSSDGSYDNVVYCDVCNDELSRETIIIPATENHSYEAVVKTPTCLKQGYTTYTCSVCQAQYIDNYTEALGHSYETTVTAPSCTEDGYTTYRCSACEDSYVTNHIAAIGHNYSSVVTEPTCTEQGYTKYICSNCSNTYFDNYIDKRGHSYTSIVTAPTCTNEGFTSYICSTCNDYYKSNYIDALGHSWSDWNITKEASVLDDGERTRSCLTCSYSETEIIDKVVIDVSTNEKYGQVNFTVVNAQTLAPIQNANIFISTENDGENTFATDENGKVSIILPVGEQLVSIYTKGYLTRNVKITVNSGINDVPEIGLSDKPIYNATVTSNEMTLEEIEAAGIDTSAPGNTHVNEYELKLDFDAEKDTISIKYYMNEDGEVITPKPKDTEPKEPEETKYKLHYHVESSGVFKHGWCKYEEVAEGQTVSLSYFPSRDNYLFDGWYQDENYTTKIDTVKIDNPDTKVYGRWIYCGEEDEPIPVPIPIPVPNPIDPSDYPINVYPISENFCLIVYGETTWLKEMFDVELLVVNNSMTDTLEDLNATLELPSGLSLADMVNEQQTLSQDIPDVAGGQSKSVHWYVRGDSAGVYSINSSLKGKIMPFGESIDDSYVLENAINVYAGDAMHLHIEFPNATFYAEDYPIRITLENVSDKTLYNINHAIKISQGMEVYYSNGTSKNKISESDWASIGVSKFYPGDKIIIEASVNIFFESELIQRELEKYIGIIDGVEKLVNTYKSVKSAFEIINKIKKGVSGCLKALVDFDFSTSTAEIKSFKRLYDELSSLQSICYSSGDKTFDAAKGVFDSGLDATINAITTDPEEWLSKHSVEDIKKVTSEVISLKNAIIGSEESPKTSEEFDIFDSLRTAISAVPVRFVLDSVVMTSGEGSTTYIPWSYSSYEAGPRYFGVSNVSKYIRNIAKMCSSVVHDEVLDYAPDWMRLIPGMDDPYNREETIEYIKATEAEIALVKAKDATGEITFKVWVESGISTYSRSSSTISNDFILESDNETAVYEDGILTFTGDSMISISPQNQNGGILYIEDSEGNLYTYVIDVVAPHECKAGDMKIIVSPSVEVDGFAVKCCETCDEIMDVIPLAYEDCCEVHNFTDWVVEAEATYICAGIKTRFCSDCGFTECVFTETIPHDHDFVEREIEKEPSCTETGVEKGVCSICGESETKDIPMISHIIEVVEAKLPTCTESGYEKYEYCKLCDYTTYVKLSATGHTNGEVVEENYVAPSCTESGSKDNVIFCTVCGVETSREQEIIPATGHILGEPVVENSTSAFCGQAGSYDEAVYCITCGFEMSRERKTVDALPHEYTSELTTAPTCTETGVMTYICIKCNDTYTESINAIGHSLIYVEAKAPICTESGYETYEYCTACEYTTYAEIPATGHSYTEEVTKIPTHTESGEKTFTCACGDSYTELIEATGDHAYVESITKAPTCTETGIKTFTCVCGDSYTEEILANGHTLTQVDSKTPTCTETGYEAYEYCSNCDYTTYVEVPATGHSYTEEVTKIPTHTESGEKTFTCACGDSYTEVIEATGDHVYVESITKAPTCTESGEKTFICACGDTYTEVIDATGHNMVAFEVVPPTCTTGGYTTYNCAACGDAYTADETSALGHTFENGACKVCGEKDPTVPEEPEYNYTFSIQSPSRTEIRNKDGIILHANVEGNAPNGSYIRWESSNGNFSTSADGSNLKIIAKNKGYTTFTAILCDADGNELARDSVEMYSKSGFFDKIGGFFRSLFGTTKIYDN